MLNEAFSRLLFRIFGGIFRPIRQKHEYFEIPTRQETSTLRLGKVT